MMAPTVVLHDGVAQLVVGSAGSNRIRSALLQVIVNVVDRGLPAQDAVDAPALHYAPTSCSPSPGPGGGLAATGLPVTLPRAQPVLRRLPGGGVRPGDGRADRRGGPAARGRPSGTRHHRRADEIELRVAKIRKASVGFVHLRCGRDVPATRASRSVSSGSVAGARASRGAPHPPIDRGPCRPLRFPVPGRIGDNLVVRE